jgi:sigma-B regulation protein RsbU (phosphoserine phosphatase)
LARARAIEETRQRNAELQIINSVQEGLASKLDVQAIYELVGDKIRQTFNAQVVTMDTYDQATQFIHSRYYFEDNLPHRGTSFLSFGFRKYVIENRRPIIINSDMPRWIKEYENPIYLGAQSKSAVFIPMIVGDAVIGVISLQNNDQENAFSDSDVRLLTTLANSMSIALENARLWEQEKLYRKALERELEIGREIQRGFLPEVLPQIDGWEIAATLLSAREVAGDFYDAFELPDGNFGLVIADVCDKGVGAALFMTLFRSLIRAAATLDYFENTAKVNGTISAADRLQRAMLLTNDYIAETHGDSGMFATIFFGILDPRTGALLYINGGHEPALLLRSGVVVETLRKTGPAVGAVMDCRFNLRETHFQHGDMLFAFTDGALDSQNPAGQQFGRDRLMAVSQKVHGSAHELVKLIESELRNHADGETQFDDITLLAIRWC